MKKKFTYILCLIFCISLLGYGAIKNHPIGKVKAAQSTAEKDIKPGSTNGNIQNSGIAAYDGNYYYFTNGKQLYKQSVKGGKSILLDKVTDKYATIDDINVLNNDVYYIKNWDIFKLNSSNKKINLTNKKRSPMNLRVVGNYIFFISHEEIGYKAKANILYRMDINGKNPTKISEIEYDVHHICVYNNKLYFDQNHVIDGISIMELDLKNPTSKPTCVTKLNGEMLFIEDNWIYYAKHNTNRNIELYRKNLTTSEEQNVLNQEFDVVNSSFNISGDYVYYAVVKYNNCKYIRYSLKDNKSFELKSEVVKPTYNSTDYPYSPKLAIVNNKLYYQSDMFVNNIKAITLPNENSNSNNKSVTQEEAINILKNLDKGISKLTPVDTSNAVEKVIKEYSSEYYMFLVDYLDGTEGFTSDYMYLVNKKNGNAYYMAPDYILHTLTSKN